MTLNDIPYITQHLLNKYDLTAKGWTFAWDNAKRRAGQCRFGRKTISVSRHYAKLNVGNRPDDVMDTILHELAHALAGPGAGHGPAWRAMCVIVGANPQRCAGPEIEMPKGKLIATCPSCKRVFHRHKQPRNQHRGRYLCCLACGPDNGRLAFKLPEGNTPSLVRPVVKHDETPPLPTKLRG